MEQMSIFECCYENYQITKPIRLIELFAGYGSQALALEFLGVNFEHYKVCEFDKYAIDTYNAFHHTNFEDSDITNLKASDLNIIERDKFTYMLTYSFPCTDLSIAGKMQGMEKESGTRSGLLWEVERLLIELGDNLPHILVMENVPQVITAKGWREWVYFLECLGYENHCEILSAKDYYIPQNRERCFMVSIVGNYNYKFPKRLDSKYLVKDFLESNVESKYFLSKKMIDYIMNEPSGTYTNCNIIFNKSIANTLNTGNGKRYRASVDNYIMTKLDEQNIKLNENEKEYKGISIYDLGIRGYTIQEKFRLMGVPDRISKLTNVSDAQKHKQAGNSIVTTCLMGIFGELLGIDYKTKIKDLVNEIANNASNSKL